MLCPNCQKENRPGMLLCEHCGHQLITLSELSRFKTGRFDAVLPWRQYDTPDYNISHPEVPRRSRVVTFDLIDTADHITLEAREHISLGRADKDSDWQPTLDLTPYGAAQKGVSRMHADIFLEKDQVFILELGSANGTWINGIRVQMGQAQPLNTGDELALGKMRMRVSID